MMNNVSDLIKGSCFALAGFFLMAVFGILTKSALQEGSVIWVSFYAYTAGSLVLFPYILYKRIGYLHSEQYSYLIGRAIFGCLASFLYTISIQYIPIVNGTLLFNTSPLFIPILTILWLKQSVARTVWVAVGLGFVGIIIIINPTEALFTQTGNIIGLLSGISLAIAYLLMKLLTKTDSGIRIIFYYLSIGALVQIPLLFFAGPLLSDEACLLALLSGVVLAGAQVSLVNGFKYAEASQIGIYQYSSVAFVALLEWILWGTPLNLRDLIGILLVSLAGMIIIRFNHSR